MDIILTVVAMAGFYLIWYVVCRVLAGWNSSATSTLGERSVHEADIHDPGDFG